MIGKCSRKWMLNCLKSARGYVKWEAKAKEVEEQKELNWKRLADAAALNRQIWSLFSQIYLTALTGSVKWIGEGLWLCSLPFRWHYIGFFLSPLIYSHLHFLSWMVSKLKKAVIKITKKCIGSCSQCLQIKNVNLWTAWFQWLYIFLQCRKCHR